MKATEASQYKKEQSREFILGMNLFQVPHKKPVRMVF